MGASVKVHFKSNGKKDFETTNVRHNVSPEDIYDTIELMVRERRINAIKGYYNGSPIKKYHLNQINRTVNG